MLGQQNIKLE